MRKAFKYRLCDNYQENHKEEKVSGLNESERR